MKRILFDARWYGDHGIGRFAREVKERLGDVEEFEGKLPPYHPLDCAYTAARLALARDRVFVSPGYNTPLGIESFAFTIHDLTHLDNPETRNRLKVLYYELVTKPACHRALCLFTVSEYSRNRIAEWAKLDASRIINVGNGVGPTFTPDGARHRLDAPYVLCPSSRKPHKNDLRALRAFARAHARDEHKLLFFGDPGDELMKLSHRLGIASRLAFLGRVDDVQLASAYRGAEVVLFPSLFEGFGLPVVEGMACGTPVITSTVGALPEVAGGAALLVDPTDEDEIADALLKLHRDSALHATLRERGLANVRRFSWDSTGSKVREALQQVL